MSIPPGPFDTYPGGKSAAGVYHEIIRHIPPHTTYAELFVGGGAIFRHIRRAARSILADAYPSVAMEWQTWLAANPQKGQVEVLSACWQDSLQALEDHGLLKQPDTFIYLDPPYPADVRSSQRNIYRHEMKSWQAHAELLATLTEQNRIGCKVMISSYPNESYHSILAGWNYHEFTGQTRSGRDVVEAIWMNYDLTALHDYRYAGAGEEARWNLTKRLRRLEKRYAQRDAFETQAEIFYLVQRFAPHLLTDPGPYQEGQKNPPRL